MLAWILGTKIGRGLALGVTAMLAALAVLWRVFAAGKAAQRQEQDTQSLNNLRHRNEVDNEMANRGAERRRADLRGWVSDDKR